MNTEVESLEFPTVDPDDQEVVEMQFADSARDLEQIARGLPSSIRPPRAPRRDKGKKRPKPQPLPVPLPVSGGITGAQAQELECKAQRLFEAREAFAAAEDHFQACRDEFRAYIESLTVKP